MKKLTLLLTVFGITLQLQAQLSPSLQLGKTPRNEHQTDFGPNEPSRSNTQSYVSMPPLEINNLLDSTQRFFWDLATNEWLPKYKTFYTQDCEIGKPTMIYDKKLIASTGEYVDTFRQAYTYFDDGSIKTYLKEAWVPSVNTWIEIEYKSYLYPELLEVDRFKNLFVNSTTVGFGKITVYSYNEDTLLSQTVQSQHVGNNVFQPQVRQTHSYNSEKLISETLFESFNAAQNVFEIAGKLVYHYDSFGRLSQTVNQFPQQGQFTDTGRTTYFYDQVGNLVERLQENFNQTLQAFVKTDKELTFYNSDNQIIEQQFRYYPTPGDTTSIYYSQKLLNYYPSGNLKVTYGQRFDIESGVWFLVGVDSLRDDGRDILYTYTGAYNGINGTYGLGYRYYYIYDDNGNLMSVHSDDLVPNTNVEWKPAYKLLNMYDDQSLLVELKIQTWDQAQNDFVNFQNDVFFNTACQASNLEVRNQNRFECLHANPISEGEVLFCPDLIQAKPHTLSIISMNGLVVHQQPFENGGSLTGIHQIPNGIYVLTLYGSDMILYKAKVLLLQPQ